MQPSASVEDVPTSTSAPAAEQPRPVPAPDNKATAVAQRPAAAVAQSPAAAAGPAPLPLARQAPESDNEGASDVCKAPTPKVQFMRMRKGQPLVVSHSDCLQHAKLDWRMAAGLYTIRILGDSCQSHSQFCKSHALCCRSNCRISLVVRLFSYATLPCVYLHNQDAVSSVLALIAAIHPV